MTNEHSHDPTQIAVRIAASGRPTYVGDAVLGAIDGSVTTLAIVAGAVGAELTAATVITLGFANLFGDGFSMAAGNFQRARSNLSHIASLRRIEESHVRDNPDGEREEIRQIYKQKGFAAPLLDDIVTTITADRERWINTMMSEEWGIGRTVQKPGTVAVLTFLAFVLVGAVPLLPFIFHAAVGMNAMVASMLLTSVVFLAIGAWRAKVFEDNPLAGGFETLLTGGAAALVAFAIARWLHGYF